MSTLLPCRHLPTSLYSQANAFYRQHGSAMKARPVHQVWVAGASNISACLCIQPVADHHGYWLTSLFVDPAARRRGLAQQLLREVRLAVTGPIWLFCRPELSSLYRRQGYLVAESLPISLSSKLARYKREKQLIALVHQG